MSHITHPAKNMNLAPHVQQIWTKFPSGVIWLNMWHKLVKLAAAFLAAEAFLLPNQPHYTGNETGAGALFQYLNVQAPLKAPCWGRSANSSTTPHYRLLASVPPPLFFQRARSFLHLPSAVVLARPERSGGLLNMRPLGATSSPSTGVADTLTAKGETGILPQQWVFTWRHVTFHSIQSSKTWASLPRFKGADRVGQRCGEELRECKSIFRLTALSFIMPMLILLLVGVLVNGAISSLRNGSKLSVKTIMNNMWLQQKGSNPTPEQSAGSASWK